MMPAQQLPRSPWALLPLFIVNWIAFANVVSLSGLFAWVIIASVITVQAMLVMVHAQRRILAGVVLLTLSAVAVGLSQLIGGTMSGPITRSTLMMTTCAGLMVLMWRTRYPASAALVSLAALAGALGLGASLRIGWLVSVWVVAVVAYLVAVGPLRSDDLRDPGRLRRLVVMLLAGGLVAILVGAGLNQIMKDPWRLAQVGAKALGGTALVSTTATSATATPTPITRPGETIRGSGRNMSKKVRGLEEAGPVSGAATGMSEYRPAEVPDYVPPPKQDLEPRSWVATVALVVGAMLLLLLLVLGIRLLFVQLKWFLLRRRLHSGTPAERVAGAWHWLRLRWAQSGYFEYVNLTPDRISRLAGAHGDRVLQDLASASTRALYARQSGLEPADAERAWQNARALRARESGPWSHRLRALLITPASANNRMAVRESGFRMPQEPVAAQSRR